MISPAAKGFLEEMAQKSMELTQKRFGKTMQMYAPMYLSNECQNICTYCGFSLDIDIPRKTLSDEEIIKEAEIVKSLGFDHILLVTGEANKTVGVEYFENAIRILKPYFANISIEVQPLEQDEYERLKALGLNAVLVYQETYHQSEYKKHHPKGKKSNFLYRLDTPDRLGKAGILKIGVGALFQQVVKPTQEDMPIQMKTWNSLKFPTTEALQSLWKYLKMLVTKLFGKTGTTVYKVSSNISSAVIGFG